MMVWHYCDTALFSKEELRLAYAQLTPARKAHIDRFRREADRTRSLAGEILVKKLLREHYGIEDGILDRKENGQPYLQNSDLYVSISHCDQMVACAVSETPVGIDIEKIRPIDEKLCLRVCTEQELAYVRDSQERFFEIWTGKEAYFKKCGTGITDLKSVNVPDLQRQLHQAGEYLIQIVL